MSDNFELEVVSPDAASIFCAFDCGNDSINEYFREKVESDDGVPVYRMLTDDGETIGLATLCCSGIIFRDHNHPRILPAIKIDYFAIDIRFQHKKYDEYINISDAFLCKMVEICREIISETIGADYIILYSVPDAVTFYKRNFFTDFSEYMEQEDYRYIENCVPLYMPL